MDLTVKKSETKMETFTLCIKQEMPDYDIDSPDSPPNLYIDDREPQTGTVLSASLHVGGILIS